MLLLPKKIGAYTLTRKLGTGGVAESYVGVHDAAGGKPVVVRRVLPYILRDPTRLGAIEARVQDLLGVRHPFLVHVMEHVHEGEEHFIVEEYIDGVNLDKVLAWCRQSGRQLPHNVFLNIATQVCNGLEALHGRAGKGSAVEHVLHLALRPGAVFITREGKVMVGSFGLSRSPTTLPHGGVTGPVPARMEYLSPEQTHPDQKLTPASDIFALGAILYELLTLEALFRADSNLQTIHKVRRAEVTTQLLRAKELMPGLDKVLYRALSLNPRHRYQRAFVLREDLRGLMAGYSFATIAEDTRTFVAPLLDGLAVPGSAVGSAPDAPADADSFEDVAATKIDADPMTTAALTAQALQERAARERNDNGGRPSGLVSIEELGDGVESTESLTGTGEIDPPTVLGADANASEVGAEDRDRPTLPGTDNSVAGMVASLSTPASVPFGAQPGQRRTTFVQLDRVADSPMAEPTTFDALMPDPVVVAVGGVGLAAAAAVASPPGLGTGHPDAEESPGHSSTRAFLAGQDAHPRITPPARASTDGVAPGVDASSTAAFLAGGLPAANAAAPRAAPPVLPPPASELRASPRPSPPEIAPARSSAPTVTPAETSSRPPPPAASAVRPAVASEPTGARTTGTPAPPSAPPANPGAFSRPMPGPTLSRAVPGPGVASAPPPRAAAAQEAARPSAPPRPAAVVAAAAPAAPRLVVAPPPEPDPFADEEPPPRGSMGLVVGGVAAVAVMGLVLLCAGGGLAGYRWWSTRPAVDVVADAPPSEAADVLAGGEPPRLEPIDPEADAAAVLAQGGSAGDAGATTPPVEAAPVPEPAVEATPSTIASAPSSSTDVGRTSPPTTAPGTTTPSTTARTATPTTRPTTITARTTPTEEPDDRTYRYEPPKTTTAARTRPAPEVYEPVAAVTSYKTSSTSASTARTVDPLPTSSIAEPTPDMLVMEAPVSDLDQFTDSAKKGRLSTADVATLEAFSTSDPQYTRSRAILLMNAQRKNDDGAVKRYLDDLMAVPENRYSPVYLTDQARWLANHKEFTKAIEQAQLAERYWARLPPELVFTKKAEIYEIEAAAWQGQFYQSGTDVELLDRAIRNWERYRDHVATRSRSDLEKRADEQIAKLNGIREKIQ